MSERRGAARAFDGSRGASPPRARFSTRRRLIVAFLAVLVASVSPLAFLLSGLRRMEATLAEMQEHEGQMRLALALEDAVRAQYSHEADLAKGDGRRLADYEGARAEAGALSRRLGGALDEPDAVRWMAEIRAASDELDRIFRERIAPAARTRDPSALVEHDRSYPLVALIERDADLIFALLQRTTSTCRAQLAALERTALRWTALLLVATPLLVVAAVLYLSRSVARPLARLSDAAGAIARGDLRTRVAIDTPDEFGALAGELDAMTEALADHQARLVESETLASVGRLAAGVAHELNNPLQVMLGYLSLDRDVPDRRVAAHLAAVEDEALRCRGIVENLLDLSRPSVEPVPVDLRALCEGAAGRVRVSVQPAAPKVAVDGAATALADPTKLGQVLFNLVKNAAEAAGPAGDVRVRIGSSGGDVEVAVRDTGPGIAPDARGRIFEPFFTTKPAGTGLGLAVSRAIARAHGGDIDVRNGDGGGAVFTLRLPCAPGTRS